jgi:thiosulfate/3-mercaptopyruvate sulfurtransferase
VNQIRGTKLGVVSRRSVLRLGVAMGTTLSSVRLVGANVAAQGTPDASAAAGDGHARPEMLIEAAALMERVGDPALTIIALMPQEEFAQGHIPGAVQVAHGALKIDDLTDAGYEQWRADMQQLFGALGVTADKTVVFYDGSDNLYATRPWWILRYLGHDKLHVLNGGFAAWTGAGGDVAADEAAAAPVAEAPFAGELRTADLVTKGQVLATLDDPAVVILDVRSAEEYAGAHVPGAVNVDYLLNRAATEPSFWLPQADLWAMYEQAGVTTDKRVIVYCRTGARASVTHFTLRLIGYDDVTLYSAGWEEWGQDPETPKAEGNEP